MARVISKEFTGPVGRLVCAYCGRPVAWRLRIEDGPAVVTVSCCGQCAGLDADVLLDCEYYGVKAPQRERE